MEHKIKHSADKGSGMLWQKLQEIQLKQMPRPAAQAPIGKKSSSTEKGWGVLAENMLHISLQCILCRNEDQLHTGLNQ